MLLDGTIDASEQAPPSENLTTLAARVRAAQEAVERADQDIVRHAMDAGDALLEARDQVRHGGWKTWLDLNCKLRVRAAQEYMQIARHREMLSNAQRAAHLSLRAALALINRNNGGPPAPKKPPPSLRARAWSDATPEQRQQFIQDIGIKSLLAALPRAFRTEIERRTAGRRAGADNGARTPLVGTPARLSVKTV
jgi:Protein of unknown function (DUF3102)